MHQESQGLRPHILDAGRSLRAGPDFELTWLRDRIEKEIEGRGLPREGGSAGNRRELEGVDRRLRWVELGQARLSRRLEALIVALEAHGLIQRSRPLPETEGPAEVDVQHERAGPGQGGK